ncbi:long-chain fatty acid--CoA ligase [Elysia marginata]|uniref:Long-chain fatty acid--CoA ligase n=1 Tax=Elysia marginata TaxID=1093978 RepID=A0AAV4EMN3_9GAST|nr:long-chain fatty acid--CoA ligase [Elysia marginata]
MAASGITDQTTLVDRLLFWRDQQGDTDAFVFYDSNIKRFALTRKELVDLASRFAYILKSSGIGHHDVVANTLSNSLERVVTDMGIILAGAAPINAIPSLTSGEVFFSTSRRSEAKAVIIYPCASDNSDWKLIKEGIDDAAQYSDAKSGKKGAATVNENKERDSTYKGLIFDYRSERAPTLKKAVLISRCSSWQRQELPEVPNFLQFLQEQPEKNSYVEKAVIPTDNGFLFTTTGTTGMQKIVPRSHSLLLKLSTVMSQMSPGTLPAMFYTTNLGWNSGFPFMFYLFGSTIMMIDELDAPENVEHEVINTDLKAPLDLIKKNEEKESKENGNAVALKRPEVKNIYAEKSLKDQLVLYDRYWCIMKKERIRFAYLSPDEITGMAAAAEATAGGGGGESREKLLLVVTGGLPIKHCIVSSALKSVSHAITIGYGMTEAVDGKQVEAWRSTKGTEKTGLYVRGIISKKVCRT